MIDGLLSLVSEMEVGEYKIKEWSIVQFSRLYPILSSIGQAYIKQGLTWDQFVSLLNSVDTTNSATLLDALNPVVPHIPALLQESLRLKPDEMEKIDFTKGVMLTLLVLKANAEHLTRFFESMIATMQPPPVAETEVLSRA